MSTISDRISPLTSVQSTARGRGMSGAKVKRARGMGRDSASGVSPHELQALQKALHKVAEVLPKLMQQTGSGSGTNGTSGEGGGTSRNTAQTGASAGDSAASSGAEGSSTGGASGGGPSPSGTANGSGVASNITFHGGTAQQRQRVTSDCEKMMAAEGKYMTPAQRNKHLDITFDNTPGGMTTKTANGAKIQLGSDMKDPAVLDPVVGHEFNNALESGTLDSKLRQGPNAKGAFSAEYMGNVLMHKSLGLPIDGSDPEGKKVLSALNKSGLTVDQAAQAYFGNNQALQEKLASAMASTGF